MTGFKNQKYTNIAKTKVAPLRGKWEKFVEMNGTCWIRKLAETRSRSVSRKSVHKNYKLMFSDLTTAEETDLML